MENSIAIKEINLINFKGLRNQTIKFNHITNISGDNGTGKTTIFDAFTWLLFGKDSTDRKDFEIKTLDGNNRIIPQIEHEVSAIIQLPGEEIEIKRILREKWVKKRGSLEAEFSGNETLYFWNEVPKSQKEYQEKVTAILDETVFKLITNPGAFNHLKWQDRRNVLIEIVGDLSDEEVANGNAEFEALLSKLTNKTLDEYKKQLASQRKKINDELKSIPTRIDEVSRNTPEALDFEKLRIERLSLGISLDKVQDKINDKTKAFDAVLENRNQTAKDVFDLKTKMQNIEFDVKQSVNNSLRNDTSELDTLNKSLLEKQGELKSYNSGLNTLVTKRESLDIEVTSLVENMASKRNDWEIENAKEINFDDEHFECPTCKRDFEAADIETKKAELIENFTAKKNDKLIEINASGKALSIQKEAVKKEIEAIDVRIENGDDSANSKALEIVNVETLIEQAEKAPKNDNPKDPQQLIQNELSKNTEYQTLKNELIEKEAALKNHETINIDDLKESKKSIQFEFEAINKDLAIEDQIKNANIRVKELECQEGKLAQEMADKEREQFTIELFIKKKIDALENMINQKFSFVKFKLFETQINGAEVECCHTLINGVPYTDANTASKLNAGLDIINTLCDYYKITSPIFIDNRESVVKILECDSQIINLIVDKNEKKLKVENGMVKDPEFQNKINAVMSNS